MLKVETDIITNIAGSLKVVIVFIGNAIMCLKSHSLMIFSIPVNLLILNIYLVKIKEKITKLRVTISIGLWKHYQKYIFKIKRYLASSNMYFGQCFCMITIKIHIQFFLKYDPKKKIIIKLLVVIGTMEYRDLFLLFLILLKKNR